jgi:molecular chaperone GrpE
MSDDLKKNEDMDSMESPESEASATNETNSLEALQEELNKAKNDYLYLRAEFDNYRRQAIKERSDLVRFAGERLAKDLLETLDIFDSALSSEVNSETLKSFVSGIDLTAQQLKSTLSKHSIVEVPALGEAFDPNLHEALGAEPSDMPPGHVCRVFKKAYKFHDKILRPAQVIVAKEKEKIQN